MQNIEAEITTTSDDSDALNNTDLAYAPGPGAVGIFLASTVADTRATVTVGNRVLKNDSLIGIVGTNAQIDVSAAAPLVAPVKGGEKIRINVDIVSAGTARVRAVWMGALQ